MRLVVLGHNDWWVWERQGFSTRNAALVRELSGRPQIESVAVIDAPRFGRRTHRPPGRRRERISVMAKDVVAVRYEAPLPTPARWRFGRRLNERVARRGLVERVAEATSGGRGPLIVWVADPRLVAAALALPRDILVFDAIDDWREHPWAGLATVREGYALAAEHADIMFAVHPSLLEWIAPRRLGEFLPNAVDSRRWDGASPDAGLACLPRPLVGYAGMIQRRLDIGLLAGVATRLPQVTFALIGGVTPDTEEGLRALPRNVRLLGPRRHDALPAMVAAFDACMVPHTRDALTGSMDPLKMYEYLAAGRPVVATVTSPNPRVGECVRLATTPEAFATALLEEIAGDDAGRREARRRAVAGETWPARTDRVLAVLEGALTTTAVRP